MHILFVHSELQPANFSNQQNPKGSRCLVSHGDAQATVIYPVQDTHCIHWKDSNEKKISRLYWDFLAVRTLPNTVCENTTLMKQQVIGSLFAIKLHTIHTTDETPERL